jgi:hypothetical protein
LQPDEGATAGAPDHVRLISSPCFFFFSTGLKLLLARKPLKSPSEP